MTTALLLLFGVVIWVWVIGFIAWMIHLHGKFRRYSRECDALLNQARAISSSANFSARLAEHRKLTAAAQILVDAQRLEMNDYELIPLWFWKLRGRWNVDYLAQAAEQTNAAA